MYAARAVASRFVVEPVYAAVVRTYVHKYESKRYVCVVCFKADSYSISLV